jgi:desulfoferrodoxin-like iron-binding protein
MLWSTDGTKEIENCEAIMSQLGKRYKCEVCGNEVLCTKAGEGTFECCGQEMKVQEPKPLPSSD